MDLLKIASEISTIEHFLTGGELENALHEIGTAELTAALDIVHNIQEEKDLRAAVHRIIVHLESAYHVLFRSLTRYRMVLRPDRFNKASYQMTCTCALVAVCHKWLGNSDKLVYEWLYKKSLHPLDERSLLRDLAAVALLPVTMSNPFFYKEMYEVFFTDSPRGGAISYDLGVALVGEEYMTKNFIEYNSQFGGPARKEEVNVEKVECVICGCKILPSTFRKYEGKCAMCK